MEGCHSARRGSVDWAMRLMLLPFSVVPFAVVGILSLSPDTGMAGEVSPPPPATVEGSPPPEPPWKVEEAHGPTHTASLELTAGTWMSVSVFGDRLVFDLLGDIFSISVNGGDAARLTSGAAWDSEPRFSPDGKKIAYVSDASGNEQIWMMDADGSHRKAFTHEDVARLTDPVWDPAGAWLYARKRTVDTRSIGVTEIWKFHLEGGKGFAVTHLDAHPHAGEVATDGKFLWFSTRDGRFNYDENPVKGLWSIVRLNLANQSLLPAVSGAGSAARPTLSPDGRSLAFISRDRQKTLLEVMDLASGKRRVVADWLDHDQMEGFALHGVYPSMAWLPGNSLVLWAGGRLWRVATVDGRRTEIPFRVKGDWTFHDVPRWPREIPDQVQARVLRWPTWTGDGQVAFSAMGALWLRRGDGKVERVSPGTGYSPSFSPDGKWLAWTSWEDEEGGRLHLTRVGKAGIGETLPVQGQLVNPTWSEDGQRLAVLRGVSGSVSKDLGSADWFEILLLTRSAKGWVVDTVTTTPNRGSAQRSPRLFLHEARIWFMEDKTAEPRKPAEQQLVSVKLDGTDKRVHLVFPSADEVVPSPDFTRVAYKSKHQGYITALPSGVGEVRVDGESLPVHSLTRVMGDWLNWTPDGKEVTWAEGSILKRKAVKGVGVPEKPEVDGKAPEPPKSPLPVPGAEEEGVVRTVVDLALPRARPRGVLALTHARVITMQGEKVIEDATLVLEGDRIRSVETGGGVPPGAVVRDCTGKTILPGLIDVHAHLHYTAGDVLPEQEWRYLTALDFGVTTVHDPSASTDLVFTQAEEVEAGFMKGPRVYSTGFILYGALDNNGAETPDRGVALAHVRRLKALGAQSVKVYQQSQRQQRQWYVSACNQEKILCVAEGGGDLWQDLSMFADGYHANEHALPNAPVYDDVKAFVSASRTASTWGTAYTPTLLVAYGGISGENWFYQNMNPLDDARLLRHFPRRELDQRTWRLSLMVQDGDWNFQQVARDAAAVSRTGTLVTLGAHGQLQGLGAHWEMWGLGGPGAMTPMEALTAATLSGARYLGLEHLLGSVEAGKMADLLVLGSNPLEDLRRTTDIAFVVKNGEILSP